VPTVGHADYIASWLEVLREDNRAIVRAASAASKPADYLLAFRPEIEQAIEACNAPDQLPLATRLRSYLELVFSTQQELAATKRSVSILKSAPR
jgi:hypothetical protein